MSGRDGWIEFACPNDACARHGARVEVPRGHPADCASCGWTMEDVDDGLSATPLRRGGVDYDAPAPREIYGRTSGFPCPKCGQADSAAVMGPDLVHILELLCPRCGHEWGVEVH